jgi:hypothetical protein
MNAVLKVQRDSLTASIFSKFLQAVQSEIFKLIF